MDIIIAFIGLGVLIMVHEIGHFFVAKWCKIGVEVFSIGFGKPLFKTVKQGIEYRIGWIPLGGYVRLKGENSAEEHLEEPDSFMYAKWWKKALIGIAGPFANLLLGILIFIITFILPSKIEDHYPIIGKVTGEYSGIFMPGDTILVCNNEPVKGWYHFIGKLSNDAPNNVKLARMGHRLSLTIPQIKPESFYQNVIVNVPAIVGDVNPGLPAWKAGLKTGDKVISVDSVSVKDWYSMREMIAQSKRKEVHLLLQRGEMFISKVVPLETNPLVDNQKVIGITQYMPVSYVTTYPLKQAFLYGIQGAVNFIAVTYSSLVKVVTKPSQFKSSLGGPVMIVSMSSQSIQKGWNYWIMFMGGISLLLMIMNLLPVPVLDGGHVFFALIHAVRGKPLSRKVQLILQNIGFAILIVLTIYALYNDFTKVLGRALSTLPK